MLTVDEKEKMWKFFNPPYNLSIAVIARRFQTTYRTTWGATEGRKRKQDAKKTNME